MPGLRGVVFLHPIRSALCYTSSQSGCRANEIRSLAVHHLHLKGKSPHVSLKAASTKAKRAAKQYILPSLAPELRELHRKSTRDAVDFYRGAEELRECMAEARAAYESATEKPDKWLLLPRNEEGGVLDFHALRHTCGAWLALKGVYPKVIQEVMRHSSFQLTFDTYGHFFPGHAADSIQHFKSFFSKYQNHVPSVCQICATRHPISAHVSG